MIWQPRTHNALWVYIQSRQPPCFETQRVPVSHYSYNNLNVRPSSFFITGMDTCNNAHVENPKVKIKRKKPAYQFSSVQNSIEFENQGVSTTIHIIFVDGKVSPLRQGLKIDRRPVLFASR